jgi:hypothetical protein
VFYEACFRGNYRAVSVLLDHIETIDFYCLNTAFETFIEEGEESISDDNHLKTIELLLNSGKMVEFDPSNIKIHFESEYFTTKAKALLDEYTFRLDGPVYNKNIL